MKHYVYFSMSLYVSNKFDDVLEIMTAKINYFTNDISMYMYTYLSAF